MSPSKTVGCNNQTIGKCAEDQACQYLQARGFILLTQNYHCYFGEIDLIMRDDDMIVFVEVRKRNRSDYGNAIETITHNKRKKLIKTATHFLQHQRWLYKVVSRFDVIALYPQAGKMQIEWLKNAFSVNSY